MPATISGRCRSGGWCLASITAMLSSTSQWPRWSSLFAGLSVARGSRSHHRARSLADINRLLLVTLLLLSPNYPWYFLVVTPFVALCGSLPNWVVSIGALLLSEQLDWDFYIPRMVTKSILFGGLCWRWALATWRTRMQRTADAEAIAMSRSAKHQTFAARFDPRRYHESVTGDAHRGRGASAGLPLSGSRPTAAICCAPPVRAPTRSSSRRPT